MKRGGLEALSSVWHGSTAQSPLRVRNRHGGDEEEAILGEIQGQSTHVSSIYHLPPQAQHITSLPDVITPSER